MRNFLQNYFYYTRGERNGFVVLLILCIALALFPKIKHTFFPPPNRGAVIRIESIPKASKQADELFAFDPNTASKDDFIRLGIAPYVANNIINYRKKVRPFQQKSDLQKIYTLDEEDYLRIAPYIEFEQQPTAYNIPTDIPTSYSSNGKAANRPKPRPKEEFTFDPNTVSKTDLKRLGLSDRVIRTMLNFRTKARFRKPSDLSKVFGLKDADYQRLRPYITIEDPVFVATKTDIPTKDLLPKDSVQSKRIYKKESIDINLAAAEEWQLLSGIGPVYAKRIVEFRDNLGGFQTIDQLAEVYSLPDSTFQKIRPQLTISPVEIQQLNINTASTDELKKHPYLKWRQAQIIVNYRTNHGNFETVEDLKKIRAFEEAFLEKIKPYVTVE